MGICLHTVLQLALIDFGWFFGTLQGIFGRVGRMAFETILGFKPGIEPTSVLLEGQVSRVRLKSGPLTVLRSLGTSRDSEVKQ